MRLLVLAYAPLLMLWLLLLLLFTCTRQSTPKATPKKAPFALKGLEFEGGARARGSERKRRGGWQCFVFIHFRVQLCFVCLRGFTYFFEGCNC